MGLFEFLPYSNKHGLNEDWLIRTTKQSEAKVAELDTKVDALDTRVETLEGATSTMQDDLTALAGRVSVNEGDISDLKAADVGIKNRLDTAEGKISDLETGETGLASEIQRVDEESNTRDNNLGNRISLLESAVINPIDVYNASENMILAGDYLLGLPVPAGMKNPYNVNQDNNSWSYDQYGFYPTATWQNLDFDTTYTVPTSGGGHQLAHAITVTTVFMTKTNEVASAYNVADPQYWTVDSKTFTSADALQELSISGIYVDIRPEGTIRVHNRAGDQTDGYRLVAIKAEKGDTASGINLNNRDQRLLNFALTYGGAAGSATHFTGSQTFSLGALTTDPEITWVDGPFMTANLDLYKDGHIVSGKMNIVLGSGQTEAITMTEPDTTPKTIDVSSLHLPKMTVTGQPIGTYFDIVNRVQYKIYGTNGADYLASMTVYQYFISETTTADGTCMDVAISYPC